MRSRSLARVLHAGPGVVLAVPPPAVSPSTLRALGAPDSELALRARQVAAELALQACEVAAALHAVGVAGLPFDERNPRLAFDEGGRPFVHWLVPAKPLGDPLFTYSPHPRRLPRFLKPAEGARRGIEMLADPVKPRSPGGSRSLLLHLRARRPGRTEALEDKCAARPRACRPTWPRSPFAFVETAPNPNRLARARAIPAVTALPPLGIDWDTVIAEGDSLLAAGDRGVAEPLADACHQRASRAWAAGGSAPPRSPTRNAPSRSTATGPRTGPPAPSSCWGWVVPARRSACSTAPSKNPPRPAANALGRPRRISVCRSPTPASTPPGGLAALALGEHAEAVRRLEMAVRDGCRARLMRMPSAPRGTPWGDVAGAAESELRSVALEPGNARYRWALVTSLRQLGRDAEARLHAEEILTGEPASTAHRERFARLFGPRARG